MEPTSHLEEPAASPRDREVTTPRGALLVTGILGVHLALLGYSAFVHSPTLDEPFHLAAGVRRWMVGTFDVDRGTPPLVGSLAALPVIAAGVEVDWSRVPDSFQVGADFLEANGGRSFWLMTLARWAVVPLSILGGLVCLWWARDLWGTRAGLLAVVLWSSCPQVLAFGALVTGDMAATSLGAAAMYAFWKWLREAGWNRALGFGLLLGLAQLARLVWLVLYPLCFVIWLCWRWWHRGVRPRGRTIRAELGQGVLILLLSLDVVNMGYVFHGFGTPLEQFAVGQRMLAWVEPPSTSSSIARHWLGALPLPLPADYVRGIDETIAIVESEQPSYLGGEYRQGGWWYYYLYGWAVKLPLGIWSLVVLASIACWAGWSRTRERRDRHAPWLLLTVSVAVIMFVTLKSGLQFLRYSLPALPFVIVWASQVAARRTAVPVWFRALVAAGLVWSTASSLLVFPHSLSYFNEIVGGPKNGYRHLLDDSYDWGQDLLFLRRWLDAHPGARPLKLAYLGWIDPRAAGIAFELPPRRSDLLAVERPRTGANANGPGSSRLTPGWYAISTGVSHGSPRIPIHDGGGNLVVLSEGDFAYFQDVTPVARAGYSIRIFRLDEEAITRTSLRIRKGERGLSESLR